MDDQASYICEACGEEIVVPIDLHSDGTRYSVPDGGDGLVQPLCVDVAIVE